MQVIHPNKDVKTFREDIRKIINEISEISNIDGNSSEDIFSVFQLKLIDYGYFEIEEIISDVYEGRIVNYKSKIEDSPAHEDQKDGFGH